MDIHGIPPHRPGDTGGPFFGEDASEVLAGTGMFGIIGALVGCAACTISLPVVLAGATVGGGLYAGGCAIKWVLT